MSRNNKCLPALLQDFFFFFVSQLRVSHGSVSKSGLKLLQMFSNDRLQCQHKPTSTFVYSIFLFDVAQMRFYCESSPSGALWESTAEQETLISPSGKICLIRSLSAGDVT